LDRSPIVTRINALLAKKNISKAEFYEKCNLTSASYSNWNTGKTRPKMKNIEKIARFLGVTSEYLLYGDGEEKESAPDPKTEGAKWDNDEDFKEAVALLKKMDKETLRVFVKAARGAVGEQQR
jgi:transcriptional regulator with XRE-family HTH domain